MNRPFPSASAVARALACLGSVVLPHVRSTSPEAEAGTRRHALIAAFLLRQLADLDPPASAEETEYLDALDLPAVLARLDIREDDGVLVEAPLAVHPTTGDVQFPGGMRAYGDLPERGYSCGTADLVAVREAPDGRKSVKIGDYKSYVPESHLPDHIVQLEVLAWARATYLRADEAEIALVVLDTPARIVHRATLTAVDFDAIEARLRRLATAIAEAPPWGPDVAEGPWCRYCPARDRCPAKVYALASLASGRSMVSDLGQYAMSRMSIDATAASNFTPAELSGAIAGIEAAHLRLSELGRLIANAEQRAREYVAAHPECGYTLKQAYQDRADVAKVLDYLDARGIDAREDVEQKIGKGKVEKRVKAAAARGQKERAWREAEEALRAAGALVEAKHGLPRIVRAGEQIGEGDGE